MLLCFAFILIYSLFDVFIHVQVVQSSMISVAPSSHRSVPLCLLSIKSKEPNKVLVVVSKMCTRILIKVKVELVVCLVSRNFFERKHVKCEYINSTAVYLGCKLACIVL